MGAELCRTEKSDVAAGFWIGNPGVTMIGKKIAHYEVTDKIGAGGMGEVYRAKDSKLGRDVALKFLPAAFAADADRLGRFEREAKLLASLNHPNIAAIYGIENDGDEQVLVLELVEGEDLSERLEHGKMPLDEVLNTALQVGAVFSKNWGMSVSWDGTDYFTPGRLPIFDDVVDASVSLNIHYNF